MNLFLPHSIKSSLRSQVLTLTKTAVSLSREFFTAVPGDVCVCVCARALQVCVQVYAPAIWPKKSAPYHVSEQEGKTNPWWHGSVV